MRAMALQAPLFTVNTGSSRVLRHRWDTSRSQGSVAFTPLRKVPTGWVLKQSCGLRHWAGV